MAQWLLAGIRPNMNYPRYATTVVGAHSVPDWYEALDRLVAVGQLSMGTMADAQYRGTQAAVLDQELAGIDVVTGGEMHRRTHNRHSPPNAMLNYFWQKIPAFQGAHAAQADHAARSRRVPSRGDLPQPRSATASIWAWSTSSGWSRR